MALGTPSSNQETPKEIRKTKRLNKRNAAAQKRAERLKSKSETKPSTYNSSTLDPNASVNYNAMNEAMFK
jgi:hypothetical protein